MTKSITALFAMLLGLSTTAWAAPAAPPIPRNVIVAAMKKADCSMPLKDALDSINVSELDRKLKLVEVPCWLAAYQGGTILFALDPAAPAKARLLRLQQWDGKKLVWTFSLTMSDFTAEKKTLASFHKGRGMGDCGTIHEWVWERSDFKLTGAWQKDECDGQPFADEDDKDKWRVYPPKR
jgi:Protein of unknown function (DUF1176)